ncbi:hypothetical protein MWU49_14405 [Alcanivorax sp. S6407]|uniref:hypothetical protein n=1 Tax=Alcanivorax sp. S6407 TaxID=2926424 RepID=UPI001FF25BE8|nr:hypothetical protein [Alcanivorax sp. S6407]MCK0154904.1 hypothetical protein [Alcanivorax sp. S6407]
MRALLTPAFLLLAACGGDDGDTIVQGSKDDQARSLIEDLSVEVQSNSQDIIQIQADSSANAANIDSLESDISALSADIADNSDAISLLNQSSAIQIYDSSDQAIGRLVQIFTDTLSLFNSSHEGMGLTSTGYLFKVDFYGSLSWQSIGTYFESPDCTGTHLVFDPAINSAALNLGTIFYDSYQPDKQLLYIPRRQSIRQNVQIYSYKNPSTGACISSTAQQDVVEAYINDPDITGVTTLGTGPYYIK